MRMLANRQIFRETEYGSDAFMNNVDRPVKLFDDCLRSL